MLARVAAAALAPLAAAALFATPAAAQSRADDARFAAAQARFDRELAIYRQEFDRYRGMSGTGAAYPATGPGGYRVAPPVPADYDGYDDRDENGYDAARYYRSGPNYRERVLANDERVYAGEDGRYYCRRSDGTTGLIIGAVGGALLGNVIDGGRSRAVGTLLGGGAGALAGREVERSNQIRCR